MAPDDLLYMLSNGNSPKLIIPMANKVYLCIDSFKYTEDGDKPTATHIISCVGIEEVEFKNKWKFDGKVET